MYNTSMATKSPKAPQSESPIIVTSDLNLGELRVIKNILLDYTTSVRSAITVITIIQKIDILLRENE